VARADITAVPSRRPLIKLALQLGLPLALSGALVTTALQAIPAGQAQTHQHHSGGGSHGQELRSDLDLLVVLAQMQGHLLVAQELIQQRNFSAAEAHVGHPVDELYGAVAPLLTARRVPAFLVTLEALRQQVRLNPTAPATRQKLLAAPRAIGQAEQAAVPAAVRNQATTQRAVVRALAAAACDEYAAAVAEGRVVETIEYQDARGFLLEAQRLLSTMTSAQPGALQTVRAMLRAFPSAQPPQRTVLSPEQLRRLQAQL
jgi:hypothetical protein